MNNENSDMIVTILGSGTCVPSLERSSCSVKVQIGRSVLVFDCGPGTMRRLLESGCGIHDVTHLFFSHFHPDHSSELVPFLFATKYPDRQARRRPLKILAGNGFLDFFGGLKRVYGDWIEIGDRLEAVVELDTRAADRHRFDDFFLTSMPMAHNNESVAFRVEKTGGGTVVYSGDTDYTENLVELARGTDLLICESSMPDDQRTPGHLTPSLAGKVARKAGAGKLVLTHFYPECQRSDIAAECRRTYDGPLLLAEDLMEIEVQ